MPKVFFGFRHSMALIGNIILLAGLVIGCVAPPAPAPTVTSVPPTAVLPSATATSAPTAAPTQAQPVPVNLWLTTSADQAVLLEPQPALAFEEQDLSAERVIYVNENHFYQQMDGFGASMTDSSAWLIYTQLSEAQRSAVMTALFSPTEGIGVSVTRIPMGASDFANGAHYSYDDMPPGETDPELAHFSIDHDRAYIIPALQDALQLNPSLKIIASPWSPPAWMKDSDSLLHGSLKPEYYATLAQYFVKFIQAYEAENLPIYAITLQNEPYYEPYSYPGMRLNPPDAAKLVKDYFRPAFDAAGLETKILVWDHNWDEWKYPLAVLNDPDAKAALDGTAWHCYAGSVIAQGIIHDAHPDKDIYFTECSGGTWISGFEAGFRSDMKDLVIGSTRNWAKVVNKWNLALDAQHNPHSGGCATCDGFVTIKPKTETGFSYNFDYYSFGHASKFVKPGAYRIASTSFTYQGLESVAFKNPDGSKVLIVANTSTAEKAFVVRWGGRSLAYALPSGAAATLAWQGEQQIRTAPAAPGDLVSTNSAGRVVLKWEFSPLAVSYTVKRAEQTGGPYTVVASELNVPEFFDTGLEAGKTYYYVVSAANALGESSDSAEVQAAP